MSSRVELVSSNGGSPNLDFALGSTFEFTVPDPERLGIGVVESSIEGSDDGTDVTGGRSDSSVTVAAGPQFLHGVETVAGEV